jgi:RHS repeat-associated protein
MPMKSRVTNMNGRIVAEERDGTRRLFQHDALGNVITVLGESGVITDTYEYWSYGEIRSQTGTSNNPWKFGGAWGYYTDASGRQYVRARTLRNDLGRWITVDPLWPSEPSYGYAGGSPIVNVDPSGKASLTIKGPGSAKCKVRGEEFRPTRTECGQFVDCVFFDIKGMKPHERGVVIQRIARTELIAPCKTDKWIRKEEVYFEYWVVVADSKGSPTFYAAEYPTTNGKKHDRQTDTWASGATSPRGVFATTGEAYYLANPSLALLATFKSGSALRAGVLWSTYDFPGWKPANVQARQSVSFNWDCCCEDCRSGCPSRITRVPNIFYEIEFDCTC